MEMETKGGNITRQEWRKRRSVERKLGKENEYKTVEGKK